LRLRADTAGPGEMKMGNIIINGEAIKVYHTGIVGAGYKIAYLKPRQVKRLGYTPKSHKHYAIRFDSCPPQLVTVTSNGYTGWVMDVPMIHIEVV
jgi:hypothetical protein